MSHAEFMDRIDAMRVQVAALPEALRPALQRLIEETIERRAKMVAAVNTIQEHVQDWELANTYTQFDLEATRRENRVLRHALRSNVETEDQFGEGAD